MTPSRLLLLTALLATLAGCANLGYYTQAIHGQFDIYAKTRRIDDVIADPTTEPSLKVKLTDIQNVRDYASRELGLPDNDSYRSYADLKRPYVVWNVFATAELSLKPTEWCFLITGCVAYRGYFSKAQADAFAAKLQSEGSDVYVGGVTAYSTLGWFHDPLLNTFIKRPLPQIAGLVFHELAHQRLYVHGDTAFNESFAMTVELEGVRRWLQTNGAQDDYEHYKARQQRRGEFVALILDYRNRLQTLYESELSDAQKREGKQQIFAELRAAYQTMKTGRWNGYSGYDQWFGQNLNNAHMVSVGMYHRYIPEFQALLARHHGNLPAFYEDAERIGRLPARERVATLKTFLPTAKLDKPVPRDPSH